ncbi:MAG: lipoprotein-releasing ABC transporter permease subunit [Rhizobiales bacterium]|nr:lipoprotein-releasing ABC transporter permease subunit [Hyphomicrobiales bacterium]NRB12842.1 lipoprotein-releasing ABC transporter permease subunit [Hyphomicrobiales bacterium]
MTIEKGQNKPFGNFERLLAYRYIKGKKRDGFISVISGFSFVGIMLGVATLIIVMSVMNGFRAELTSKILGMNGHIVLTGISVDMPEFDEVANFVRSIEGVTNVAPVVDGQVLASGISANSGVYVRGMREQDIKDFPLIYEKIIFGSIDGFDASDNIAIGSRMAAKFGVNVGDAINLISPNGSVTPFGTSPRQKNYTVAAIFEVGESRFDSQIVLMPFAEAQLYFNKEGKASAVEVMTEDPDDIDFIKTEIFRLATANDIGLYMVDWQQSNGALFSALKVERNVMFIILMLIIIIASFNIISGMIMLVKDKIHDIAILRTMGAGRGSVQRVFFMTGGLIGIAGTLFGLLLGVLVCVNIESIRSFFEALTDTALFSPELYFLSELPAKMHVGEITSIVGVSLILSLLATVYPSYRAAKTDPVKALRFE